MAHRWERALRRARPRDVILMYHGIGPSPSAVPTERFKAQMLWLKNHAKVVSLDELLASRNDVNTPVRCVISFDDGYVNLYTEAFPILADLGFPAIAYVPAGVVGETNQPPAPHNKGLNPTELMLNWAQLREMDARGITIGSHSFDHVDLSQVSRQEVSRQLEISKAVLAKRLGHDCRHFAYPWGRFNADTVQAVKNAGYESAATVLHKGVTAKRNRFLIPRVTPWGNYTIRDFEATVLGDFDCIAVYQQVRAFLSFQAWRHTLTAKPAPQLIRENP